jgi:hypothetical protein
VGQEKQAGYKISVGKEWAQSNPRKRPGWMYSQGVARDSCSSMYKCMKESHDVGDFLET